MPSVVETIACVSPRVKIAEPWARGRKWTVRLDRADRLGVAPVDAAAVLEDGAADDVGLELLHQLQRREILRGVRSLEVGEGFAGLGPGLGDRGLALLLVGDLVGGLEIACR